MEEIKLLHTSDLHIDWLFENFSAPAKSIRRQEIIKSLDIIADIALQQQVRAILISGDLFHAPQVDRTSVAAVIATFLRLAKEDIKVLIIPGNHDPLAQGCLYSYVDFPDNVHVFLQKGWSVYKGIPNLNIYGIPYCDEDKDRFALSELQAERTGGYNVALLHGSYKDLRQLENYMPFTDEDIEKSNFDYIALGHYHNYKDCSRGKVKCIYPGSPNALSFNNTGERLVVVVRLSLAGTEVKKIPVPGRKYIQFEYDMTNGNTADMFNQIAAMKDPAACLRVIIRGIAADNKIIDREQAESLFRDDFFYLDILDRTTVYTEESAMENSVKSLFIKKMKARLEDPQLNEEEREIVRDALRIGYQALERGRF